jgi:hypothetical protein
MGSERERAVCDQSGAASTFSSITLTEEAPSLITPPQHPLRQRIKTFIRRLKASHSLLVSLPPHIPQFLGYRPPSSTASHEAVPIPPFKILQKSPSDTKNIFSLPWLFYLYPTHRNYHVDLNYIPQCLLLAQHRNVFRPQRSPRLWRH